MKRRVTERVLVLILSVAVLLSSTGIYTVFAEQQNTTTSAEVVTESTTVEQEPVTQVVTDTEENIVEGGGAIEPNVLEGDGTADHPYLIADIDDLFLMQNVINDASKSEKNFRLVADIDLSGITAEDLKKNTVTPGTIISIDKTLNAANPGSIWFNLNAANHKIFGLNVTNTEFDGVAIFGYLGRRTTVKNLVVENCNVTVNNDKATKASVVALENNATFRNSTVSDITLNVKTASANAVVGGIVANNTSAISDVTVKNVKVSCACAVESAGAVTGVNAGTVSGVKASSVSVVTSKENVTDYIGAVAGINNSTIKNCAVNISALTYGAISGGIAGFNKGTIENNIVTSGSSDSVILSTGISGAIAGKNAGKIIASTAMGIVADCDGVYGGVAGEAAASSTINNCVTSGSVKGKAVNGGIAGKADATATIKNSYTFTALSGNTAHGAVIGEGVAITENNYWSSDISGRFIADESGSQAGKFVTGSRLITVKAGESKKLGYSSFGASAGAAVITADSENPVSVSGTGVKLTNNGNTFTLEAISAGKVATISYSAKITVKAGYNNSTVISRNMTSSVITLSEDAKGNGLSAETPVVIESANELTMLKAVPFGYFELSGDMDMPENWTAFDFCGSFNGAGHTLNAHSLLFTNVFGEVKNITVKLNNEIKTSMFGSANGARFENVRLVKGENEEKEIRLVATTSGVSPFLNKVMGNTVINSCYAEIPVHVMKKEVSNVAGLVAVVDSKNATLTSSGANVTITSEFENKLANSAGSIGYVRNNAEGSINGCFATLESEVVDYALIGGGVKENFKAENNLVSFGTKAVAPQGFNVTATQWIFDAGSQGFIAGRGSVVSIKLPTEVALFNGSDADDFTAIFDSTQLNVNTSGITVDNGIIYLPTQAAEDVITVLNSEVTLVHKPTGLRATIGVSNGLEKDENGNYIIYYAVDIAFVGENLDRFNGSSFVLANDIDMSTLEEFTCMGSASQAFNGTFDGRGHTITGMNIDGTSKVGLFGALENAKIQNLVIDSAVVKATGSYAGVLAGQISKNTTINNITIKNGTVCAEENYAGILSGRANGENINISAVKIEGGNAKALNYAGGVIGYVDGKAVVNASDVSAVSVNAAGFAGGVAGYASQMEITAVNVDGLNVTADKNAGGIAGAFAGEIKASSVKGCVVAGDYAGGFIGATIKDTSASAVNCNLISTKVNAPDGSTAAGGFIASVADSSSASVGGCSVSADSSVTGANATGGFIGDVQGSASVVNSASYAAVQGMNTSSRLPSGAGGVIGKVSSDDFGSVSVKSVNIGGTVNAYGNVGGIIGSVLSEKADRISVSDCVMAAKVSCVDSENAGLVIGSINEDIISESIEKIVYSSYGSNLTAYAGKNGDGTYTDIDRFVETSLNGVVLVSDEVKVNVNNAKIKDIGFVFDDNSGWQSESEERLTVIRSSENEVVFVANKTSDCAVVASYALVSDRNIVVKVHFNVKADIRLALYGEGTKESPYIITNGFELDSVRDYMGEDVYFVLANDINFTKADFEFGGGFYNDGFGFAPIGTDGAPFTGTFDGAGYSINGLKISGDSASLFGTVENAQIKNVAVNATVEGVSLAAAVASKADNSSFENITVSGAVSATSENASVSGVVAFANESEFNNINIKSISVSTLDSVSNTSVVYAAGVVARAIDTKLENINVNSDVNVTSAGYAGAVAGYGENIELNKAETYAAVDGEYAGGLVAKAVSVKASDCVASGSLNGKSFTAGIAGVVTEKIEVSDTIVSASMPSEKSAVAVYDADEKIDSKFSNIIYSTYSSNSPVFGDDGYNSAQLESCAGSFTDINSISPVSGDKLTIGKDAEKLEDIIKLDFNAQGNAKSFTVGNTEISVTGVASTPEGLVAYGPAGVSARSTKIDGAELVIEYTKGLKASVEMITVSGMSGDGTKESPYEISNEDTMLLLAIYPDAHFVLVNDVTLSKEWTPVSSFCGTLDGNGHSIRSLKVNADNAGLFETLDLNAKVSDVSFIGAEVSGKANAGVVVANVCGNTQLMNIKVLNSTVKSEGYSAAIAGNINSSDCLVSGCQVEGSSVEGKEAAGVIAVASGKVYIKSTSITSTTIDASENAAGIAATVDANDFTADSCDVSADINGNNASGIVAIADSEIKVVNCDIDGTVNGINAESGIVAVVNGELSGKMKVKGNNVSAALSGEAENSASVVGVFTTLPEDNTVFSQMFNNNKVYNDSPSFQPEVMQYQNLDVSDVQPDIQTGFKGEGTQSAPYEIYNIADLDSIPDSSDAYYVLMNDIIINPSDYTVAIDENGSSVYGALYDGYTPVKDFAGSFDGNGHIISGLYIDSEDDFVGLFAKLKANAVVKNVHLKVLDDSQGYGFSGITGGAFVGGIAGYCESVSGIINSSVEGGSINGERAVGSIVGELASSKVVDCVAMTVVNAENGGGIAGSTKGNCSVENTVTASTVNASGGTVAGINEGNLAISDVLSTGSAKGTDSILIGKDNGLVSVERAVIGGTNAGKVTSAVSTEDVEYVYSDVTSLGTTDKDVASISAGNLMTSIPLGLEGWVSAEGRYPAPLINNSYSQKLISLASVPVIADAKEGGMVADGFAYPVKVNVQGITVTSSTLSGENDLVIKNGKIYNDIFTGDMPYITVEADNLSRRIVLPQQSDENTVYISLSEQLRALSNPENKYASLSKYLNNEDALIVLSADIDFEADGLNKNNSIKPIENYLGSFDGNGFTVRNMRIDNSNGATGLFASIGGETVSEFKDISFTNVFVTGCGETGALAGKANENVAVDNVKVIDETANGSSYVSGAAAGAIIGSMNGGTVNNAFSSVAVDGSVAVGGIIGYSDAVITNSHSTGTVNAAADDAVMCGIGGLVGVMNSGAILTSSSLSDVNVSSVANATDSNSVTGIGGLAGVANDGKIEKSFSAGTVKVSGADAADNSSVVGIGGLAGVSGATVESTYSASAVTADFTASADGEALRALGGLVGVAKNDVKDSYSSGGVSATRDGVKLYGSDCFLGGVIGYGIQGDYENLYFDKYMNNDENLTAVSNVINETCFRVSSEDLISAQGLSSEFVAGNGTYPYLKAAVANADAQSIINSALSVIVTVADGDDSSVKDGSGATKPVTLPGSISLGSKAYALNWSAGESAVIDGAKAALNRTKPYADYMSLTVSIDSVYRSYDRLYADEGLLEETIGNTLIEYSVENESGRSSMDDSLIGILIKSRLADGSVVTSDVFTTCDAQPVRLNKLLVTAGGFYVDSSVASGYRLNVTAKDSAGNEITVTDAGCQGVFVETANADTVTLKITIVNESIPWGLTSLWESLKR